jgi:hypothetical protein
VADACTVLDKCYDSVHIGGGRYMTPADLLHSLVAVYPPDGTTIERAGALRGDKHSQSPQLPDMIKVKMPQAHC